MRLYKYWSNSGACYAYMLEIKRNQMLDDIYCGDLEWAKKIAEHYNIEIEDDTNDKDKTTPQA